MGVVKTCTRYITCGLPLVVMLVWQAADAVMGIKAQAWVSEAAVEDSVKRIAARADKTDGHPETFCSHWATRGIGRH